MKIYVGNLSFDTTDVTLQQAFEAFGQVTSVKVIKDRHTDQSKGFAFVEMAVESQAETAIKSLDGKEIMGRQVKVQQAHEPADRGRRGGRMDYDRRRH